jgi:hypothetical protein
MGRSSSTIRIFGEKSGVVGVDINAPSRKYQDAGHSSAGRVNLGARIAPKASRKCQGNLPSASRLYRGIENLPKSAEEALIPGVGKRLD